MASLAHTFLADFESDGEDEELNDEEEELEIDEKNMNFDTAAMLDNVQIEEFDLDDMDEVALITLITLIAFSINMFILP